MSGAMAGLLSDAIWSPPGVTPILVLLTGGQHFGVGQIVFGSGLGTAIRTVFTELRVNFCITGKISLLCHQVSLVRFRCKILQG